MPKICADSTDYPPLRPYCFLLDLRIAKSMICVLLFCVAYMHACISHRTAWCLAEGLASDMGSLSWHLWGPVSLVGKDLSIQGWAGVASVPWCLVDWLRTVSTAVRLCSPPHECLPPPQGFLFGPHPWGVFLLGGSQAPYTTAHTNLTNRQGSH